MKTPSLNTQHSPSLAASTRHGASIVWSGFMVKYGNGAALDIRMQEVRG